MEDIHTWIRELRLCSKAIIVEGKKDKLALEHFGIYNVFTLTDRPLYDLVEEVSEKFKKINDLIKIE